MFYRCSVPRGAWEWELGAALHYSGLCAAVYGTHLRASPLFFISLFLVHQVGALLVPRESFGIKKLNQL